MYALYTGYSDNLQLHQDDIDGAVAAMGAGTGSVTPLGEGEEICDLLQSRYFVTCIL